LCIPKCLMISEETCLNDPDLKLVYSENSDIFCRDDPVITLFLMREMTLGEKSFYFPYLSILPYPETVQDWTSEELEELQDMYVKYLDISGQEKLINRNIAIFLKLSNVDARKFNLFMTV
jgi:hypothetical protein